MPSNIYNWRHGFVRTPWPGSISTPKIGWWCIYLHARVLLQYFFLYHCKSTIKELDVDHTRSKASPVCGSILISNIQIQTINVQIISQQTTEQIWYDIRT